MHCNELYQNSLVGLSSVSCCVILSKFIPRLATEISSETTNGHEIIYVYPKRIYLVTYTVDFCLASNRTYAIPHVTKRETDNGQKSGYYATILSGKEDRGIGA